MYQVSLSRIMNNLTLISFLVDFHGQQPGTVGGLLLFILVVIFYFLSALHLAQHSKSSKSQLGHSFHGNGLFRIFWYGNPISACSCDKVMRVRAANGARITAKPTIEYKKKNEQYKKTRCEKKQ